MPGSLRRICGKQAVLHSVVEGPADEPEIGVVGSLSEGVGREPPANIGRFDFADLHPGSFLVGPVLLDALDDCSLNLQGLWRLLESV